MKYKPVTLVEIEVACGAMESWVDAFADDYPEDAVKVRRVIEEFNALIAQMKGPGKPSLRLVGLKDEVN